MTTIKPPGSPGIPPVGVDPGAPIAAPSASKVAPSAPSTVSPPSASPSTNPTQAILGDLQAARITPDEAVRRLTAAAIEKAHTPAALRPAVESRIRAMLANDPRVGTLLRRMGAEALSNRRHEARGIHLRWYSPTPRRYRACLQPQREKRPLGTAQHTLAQIA